MKTSQNGLAFIAQNEGIVLHVYPDSLGNPTIGVGHMLTASEKASGVFANGITMERALELLSVDVGTAESWVNKGVTVSLTQDQFDALVDFTFNCGGGAFTSSTLLKLLNAGNYQGAADQFLVWDIPAAVIPRRQRERTLFLTPDPVVVTEVVQPPVAPVQPVVVATPPTPVVAVVPPAPPTPLPDPPSAGWQALLNFFTALLGKRF